MCVLIPPASPCTPFSFAFSSTKLLLNIKNFLSRKNTLRSKIGKLSFVKGKASGLEMKDVTFFSWEASFIHEEFIIFRG